MGSYPKLEQPLPTIQEVPESEVAATEARIRQRELELEARERELERRLQALEVAEQAAARRAAPEVSWAHKEVVEKKRDAIRSMEAVEEACGHALENARRLLEGPCAKSAASALMDLAQVAKSCDSDKDAFATVKAAERAVRDVVVLRCCSQAGTADRSAFLEAAEEAFGRPLDRELRAKLLLAFHKIFKNQPDTFLSNTQRATQRRGGRPRPRRPRPSVVGATTKEQSKGEPMYVFLGTIPLVLDASAQAFFDFLGSSHVEDLNGTACALPPSVLELDISCPRDGSWRESEDAIY